LSHEVAALGLALLEHTSELVLKVCAGLAAEETVKKAFGVEHEYLRLWYVDLA
jgi:hypothetical protein